MSHQPYSHNAQKYFEQYQSLAFEQVHASWLPLINEKAGLVLDVGAGSGRDALALARKGWDVIAVEPAADLRNLAEQHTADASIQWLDDTLPDLHKTRSLAHRFDLILVSAVWMHLAPNQRERAFRILSDLLAPGGLLIITLRHGPGDGERTFHPVSKPELDALAQKRALITVPVAGEKEIDQLNRDEVSWQTAVYRLPDDGTGALPTTRHIIVNDSKSSSYKLGLLRALVRLADQAPGILLRRDDDWVELPLGAVSLFWLLTYHPLVLKHRLRQAPGTGGYGFAREAFYQLGSISSYDLRIGMSLSADLAPVVLQALKDISANLLKNPARFTTWPGTERSIFEGDRKSFRIKTQAVRLDRETLAKFGVFRVPTALWDTFSRYACWIEPAIINEWVQLMQQWNPDANFSELHQGLRWMEGRRDTSRLRRKIDHYMEEGSLQCVWSDRRLNKNSYDVDHCFPWSRWQNNDLWNLLPSTRAANNAKSERLPSSSLLKNAQPRILSWWEEGILGTELESQFFVEAGAALPLVGDQPSLQQVFAGMSQQRLRLKNNLQLAEWYGLSMHSR